MHTIRLFKENVYKKEAEAVITSLSWQEGKFILTLDQTIFFPEGGGQTCDLGTIAGFEVSDVSEHDGDIYHTVIVPKEKESEAKAVFVKAPA